METYTIIHQQFPKPTEYIKITKEGALIIWAAYEKMFGKNCQTMERREERGGVCHLSEIDLFKKDGALDPNFDYKNYLACTTTPK